MGYLPLGTKVHLRKVLTWPLAFITVMALSVGVIFATIAYFFPGGGAEPEPNPAPVPTGSGSWWSNFGNFNRKTPSWLVGQSEVKLCYLLLPLVHVVSVLYRYDRNPTPKEVKKAPVLKLPASAALPAPEVGEWMVVLPLHYCILGRIKALRGVRPYLTYSILAVLVSMVSVAIVSIILSLILVRSLFQCGLSMRNANLTNSPPL